MNVPVTPLIIQPEELAALLHAKGVVIADLSQEASYELQHIPGAVHIDAARLASARPPVMGLLPSEETLQELLAGAGITPDSHVIAYDGENGLKASRFLWILDVIGHRRFSFLNGGLSAWTNAGLPLDDKASVLTPSAYPVAYGNAHRADKDYIRNHLKDRAVVVLDTRTPAEYSGTDRRALQAGHIPGAVNLDWSRAIVGSGDFRLKPAEELRAMYTAAGITPDKEIIVHCQTHQRSSHTYIVLKSLGYARIKGYPGSWSDWGNDPEMPVEPAGK